MNKYMREYKDYLKVCVQLGCKLIDYKEFVRSMDRRTPQYKGNVTLRK